MGGGMGGMGGGGGMGMGGGGGGASRQFDFDKPFAQGRSKDQLEQLIQALEKKAG
jgi:hypothetical protein